MRKLTIFVLLLLLMSFAANAETVLKTGFLFTSGKVGEHSFTLSSIELKLEQSIWSGFGLGIGFRKETSWLYSGYYISLYPMYKINISKNWFLALRLGAEYGLSSSEYDYYRTTYDEAGNLISHKWIYLIQNAPVPGDKLEKGNIGILYFFADISSGIKIWGKLFIEAGVKVQMMKFEIKSCELYPLLSEVKEKEKWQLVPSLFIQLGYKF